MRAWRPRRSSWIACGNLSMLQMGDLAARMVQTGIKNRAVKAAVWIEGDARLPSVNDQVEGRPNMGARRPAMISDNLVTLRFEGRDPFIDWHT